MWQRKECVIINLKNDKYETEGINIGIWLLNFQQARRFCVNAINIEQYNQMYTIKCILSNMHTFLFYHLQRETLLRAVNLGIHMLHCGAQDT